MYRVTASILAIVWVTVATTNVTLAGSPVNMTRGGHAIGGYDVVAYFNDGRPTVGDEQYGYEWLHATWLFATAENRDLFAADPARFMPAYGGYCAYAVALGLKLRVDPHAWSIVDDRLFLNESLMVRKAWRKETDYYIPLGDEVWEGIKYQ